jgi:hypothetical protein
MWRLIFGLIILVFIVGCVFALGFGFGAASSPLNPDNAAAAAVIGQGATGRA